MIEKPPLEERIQQALDARSERPDASALARLAQARVQAISDNDRQSGKRGLFGQTWLVPVAGAASLVFVLIGFLLLFQTTESLDLLKMPEVSEGAPLEILTVDVDVELLEDIDFYDWLGTLEADGDSV